MNFVHAQLETNHHNGAGSAFYAYFSQEPSEEDWREAVQEGSEGERLGLVDPAEWGDREEVPTPFSARTGLRRYYLGGAG